MAPGQRGPAGLAVLVALAILGSTLPQSWAMSPDQEAAIDLLRKRSPRLAAEIQSGLDKIDRSNASEEAKQRQREAFLSEKLDSVGATLGERNDTYRLVRDMKQQDDGTTPENRSIEAFDELKAELGEQVDTNRRQQAFINIIKRANPTFGSRLEAEFRRIESDPNLSSDEVNKRKRAWLEERRKELEKAAETAEQQGRTAAARNMRDGADALFGLDVYLTDDPQKNIGVENADLGAFLYRAYLLEYQRLGGKVTVRIPAAMAPPKSADDSADESLDEEIRRDLDREALRRLPRSFGSSDVPGTAGGDACSVAYAGDFGNAPGFQLACWHVSLGLSASGLDTDAVFGSGTIVSGGDEFFAAEAPSRINRFGFDMESKYRLRGGGLLFGERAYVIGGFSYASGSESAGGGATVGEDGVTRIALTYLTPVGPETGAFTETAGNFIESSAEADNSWSLISFGYAEAFRPNGPSGTRWQIGLEGFVEWLNFDYAGLSEIYRPGAPDELLAYQEIFGESRTTWVGARLSASLSYPLTDRFSVGLAANITPAYRVSEASLEQFTSIGPVEQEVGEDFKGFVFGGGIGASLSYEVTDSLRLKLSYERSSLPGVAQVHVPASPPDQPATIESGTIARDMLRVEMNYRF